MQGNFTEKAKEAIRKAQQYAVHLGHNYVGTEHLLLGLVGVKDSVASKAIEAQGITEDAITEKIDELVCLNNGGGYYPQDYTPRSKRVIDMSVQEAIKMGTGYVGTEHILLALIQENDSIAVRILASLGVNGQKLYEVLCLWSVRIQQAVQVQTETARAEHLLSINTAVTLQKWHLKANSILSSVVIRKSNVLSRY